MLKGRSLNYLNSFRVTEIKKYVVLFFRCSNSERFESHLLKRLILASCPVPVTHVNQ